MLEIIGDAEDTYNTCEQQNKYWTSADSHSNKTDKKSFNSEYSLKSVQTMRHRYGILTTIDSSTFDLDRVFIGLKTQKLF